MTGNVNDALFRELMHVSRKIRMQMHMKKEEEMREKGFCPPPHRGHPGMPVGGPGMMPPFGPHHHHHGRCGHGHFPRERVLMIIADAGDAGIHQKEIAEEIFVSPSTLSELITKLEDDNYVERKVDPDDKRATLITLTEKGQARAYEVSEEHGEFVKDFFAGLTEDEKLKLLELLKKASAK